MLICRRGHLVLHLDWRALRTVSRAPVNAFRRHGQIRFNA